MQDTALLEATGSEPLTYDEEVEMQQSWLSDEKKCTFIVHAIEECHYTLGDSKKTSETESISENKFAVEKNLDAMIGDVNLFLSEIESEIGEVNIKAASEGLGSSKQLMQAEVDIMIARKDYRGKGLGRAATCAMLLYGATQLGIRRFFCKINEDNTDSIRMFKAIGFEECNYAACFKQVELELWKTLPELEDIFKHHGGSYSIIPCCTGK
jgi:RimJ/RimL family protein N-acetyltransferase